MSKIILPVGPPGCGKTIWSKLYVENHKAKRLSRDDLRAMMQNSEYGVRDEKVIKRIRNYAIESWLQQGYDVVVDDTNLTPDVFPMMQRIARRVGDVGVEEHVIKIEREICWFNNTHRKTGVVPLADWNDLWLKYTTFEKHGDYYAPPRQIAMEMYFHDYQMKIANNVPRAIIIDLDETLALHKNGRDPYNHEEIPTDIPNYLLNDLVTDKGEILIVTGRSEESRSETEKWIEEHQLIYDELFMRPLDKPTEHDYIIKKEIYENHIKDNYFVYAVFEDREQNIELWRDLGLMTYQINFGRY